MLRLFALQAQFSGTVYLQNYVLILTVLNLLLIAVLKRFIFDFDYVRVTN